MPFSSNHTDTDAVNVAVLTPQFSQQMYNGHIKKVATFLLKQLKRKHKVIPVQALSFPGG
jgi:hypothetical protein